MSDEGYICALARAIARASDGGTRLNVGDMAGVTAKIQQGRGLKGSIDLAFFAYFFWQLLR